LENPNFSEISRKYFIPHSTLTRHYNQENSEGRNGIRQMGRAPVFSQEVAELLVHRILQLEERMMGINITMLKNAAFDLAELLGISHSFNQQIRSAGDKWYYNFLSRFTDLLSLRRPQAVSIARLKGFNRQAVDSFFEIYGPLMADNGITGASLYNMDESGYSIVQNRCCQVIARKGKKRIGAIACGERGVNTTAVVCMSPSGFAIPPMLIFKGTRLVSGAGAPEGSLVRMAETGYINSNLFYEWMLHFIQYSRASKSAKVLLLLDGHSSHTMSLRALTLADDNGVIIMSLPAHSTHRMQPLDVGLFKSLNLKYANELESWLRKNPGKVVSQATFCELFRLAYDASKKEPTAANSFRATGMWPVNRDVYSDADFVASEHLTGQNVLVSKKPLSVAELALDKVLPLPTVDLQKPKRKTTSQGPTVLTSEEYLGKLANNKQKLLLRDQEMVTKLEVRLAKAKLAATKRFYDDATEDLEETLVADTKPPQKRAAKRKTGPDTKLVRQPDDMEVKFNAVTNSMLAVDVKPARKRAAKQKNCKASPGPRPSQQCGSDDVPTVITGEAVTLPADVKPPRKRAAKQKNCEAGPGCANVSTAVTGVAVTLAVDVKPVQKPAPKKMTCVAGLASGRSQRRVIKKVSTVVTEAAATLTIDRKPLRKRAAQKKNFEAGPASERIQRVSEKVSTVVTGGDATLVIDVKPPQRRMAKRKTCTTDLDLNLIHRPDEKKTTVTPVMSSMLAIHAKPPQSRAAKKKSRGISPDSGSSGQPEDQGVASIKTRLIRGSKDAKKLAVDSKVFLC
jgi:DDE superfamily endonuclease